MQKMEDNYNDPLPSKFLFWSSLCETLKAGRDGPTELNDSE